MEPKLPSAILLHGELVRHSYSSAYAFVRGPEEMRGEFIHDNFSSSLVSKWVKYTFW
jgi:hypothetical protein